MTTLSILFPDDGESWSAFLRRASQMQGELLLVLSGLDHSFLESDADRMEFLKDCAAMGARVRLATKYPALVSGARSRGIRVIDRTNDLRKLLQGHPGLDEALRVFSPHLWRQHLRTRLQSMGLLALPKLRVWILITVSAGLFLFIFFRLLPSADIRVWPREDAVSQTANIFLVQSGAQVDLPKRVRSMELLPITVTVRRSMAFDQISKEFIGTTASVAMTVVNNAGEPFSFKKGSRLVNEAGMVFRIQEPVTLESGAEMTVRATADDVDLYGEIIGERGNVPAGVRWEFAGLAPSERKLVYGENRVKAEGGTTSYRTVLNPADLEVARKRLEQELLSVAKQLVEEERALSNAQYPEKVLQILYYDELTKADFHDFVMPEEFIGTPVQSVPVEGSVTYSAYAYDISAILSLLTRELHEHVSPGKTLLEESLTVDHLVVHVIAYDDHLAWIKLTVDLTGTEQFVLDPLSPTGVSFGRKVREAVVGTHVDEALRIIQNLPEVEKVQVSLWPPWSRTLPPIPSHLSITPMEREHFLMR